MQHFVCIVDVLYTLLQEGPRVDVQHCARQIVDAVSLRLLLLVVVVVVVVVVLLLLLLLSLLLLL